MSNNFVEMFAKKYSYNIEELMDVGLSEGKSKQIQKKYRNLVQLFESMEEEGSSFGVSADRLIAYIRTFPRRDKQEALMRQLINLSVFDTVK